MRRVMAFYPPGPAFQRGEDRCQANIDGSTSSAPRADNDLGYASSTLKSMGFDVFIRDYQNERLSMSTLLGDFAEYSPDVIFLSTTNATIFYDLDVVRELRAMKANLVVVLKGALFFNASPEMLGQLNLGDVDYLIGGESEFILPRLLSAHFEYPQDIPQIGGIFCKSRNTFKGTGFDEWDIDLDILPFPDRRAMNNRLYVRPDTGEPMATIAASRGCPFNCIYCLTPVISGRSVRFRSPENVFAEIEECYVEHGIRDFFFRSDTFTADKRWVSALCDLIDGSSLSGRIAWVANSRVSPLERETLVRMKRSGCWLVAFGFESGSPETLKRIKKGATVEEALRVAGWCKELGLKVFGFYMIGFPWEDMSNLETTKDLMFRVDADYVEVHIAIPFYGTPLYNMAQSSGLLEGSMLGKDYFSPSMAGTLHLKSSDILRFRKSVLREYHLRPSYIIRKILHAGMRPRVICSYARYGCRLLRNTR